MAYNKDTNWENEKKYLDNLSKNGTAGEKAWAESQKKTLAAAEAQYSGSSGGGASTGGTSGVPTNTLAGAYVSGGVHSGSTSNAKTNSQYTGSSNAVKVNNSLQQTYKDEMNANSIAWHNADEAEKKRLEARNQELASLLGGTVAFDSVTGTWNGNAGGITQEGISNWKYGGNKPAYESKSASQIDALLTEILNRDDFYYDAKNDPLYQQYAKMYQREGDRAMKETLAEAAAGAGGMNTYAITAAQQANSYYNSQLNDKIPELYQLAYEMYLQDKESKVQDLGILQSMDATQYNRYRDTMNDWKDDRNFAYGQFQDAVQQGNWQTTFDNNNYWAEKNFDFNKEQADISNSQWQQNFDFNKEQADISNSQWQQSFDYNVGRDNIGDSRYDKETAYDRAMDMIGSGVMPNSTLLETAEISPEKASALVAAANPKTTNGTSSGGGSGKSTDYTIRNTTDAEGDDWISISGMGRVTFAELEKMVDKGTVIEEVDDKNKEIYYRKA